MTKEEIRELIQTLIQEYTGAGSSGGNAGDGNNRVSQRDPGGSFTTAAEEIEFYTDLGAPFGGAEGQHTRGMEKSQSIGNYNRTRFIKI
jgi:hypothetical protein